MQSGNFLKAILIQNFEWSSFALILLPMLMICKELRDIEVPIKIIYFN